MAGILSGYNNQLPAYVSAITPVVQMEINDL